MKTKEMRLGTELCDESPAARDGMSRRTFMGGMGAVMAGAALAGAGRTRAFADEAEEEEDEAEEETASNVPVIESTTGWTGTPEELLALGISTMPLEDLNQYRKAYLDAQTDYVKEDGTVVPAIYVKVRALINAYGFGSGNTPNDTSFDDLMIDFSEDDAQAFIDMPMGIEFTAYEMAVEEGRELDECVEICERLASGGYLCAYDNNKGRCYHHVPVVIGVAEYHLDQCLETDNAYTGVPGSDFALDLGNSGTPPLYYVPVDESVTSDGTILPYDDVKAKARQANVACISPCYCRYKALAGEYGHENIPTMEDFLSGEYEDYFSGITNERVETCLYFGDEAQYWIDRGMARQITGEQAAEYIQRSVDDGFMIESTFEKNLTCVCSCTAKSCLLTNRWLALGDAETIASYLAFNNVSHYRLEVDPDKCIACGLCVDRCPVQCITINDEGWAEAAANCFRCGQCAYVCPQGARKLVQRDESEFPPLQDDHLTLNNLEAAYRFEMGFIKFPETQTEA